MVDIQLLNIDNGVILDHKGMIYNFLKSQYNYEVNRIPVHRIFKENYPLDYFDENIMLTYYINPLGDNGKQGIFLYTPDCIDRKIHIRTVNYAKH